MTLVETTIFLLGVTLSTSHADVQNGCLIQGSGGCLYPINSQLSCDIIANVLDDSSNTYGKETYDMVKTIYDQALMTGAVGLDHNRPEANFEEALDNPEDEKFLLTVQKRVKNYLSLKNRQADVWKLKYEELLDRYQQLGLRNTKLSSDNTVLKRKVVTCNQDKLIHVRHISRLNQTVEYVTEQKEFHREESSKTRNNLNELKQVHNTCQQKVADTDRLFILLPGNSAQLGDQDTQRESRRQPGQNEDHLEWREKIVDFKRNFAEKQNTINSLQNTLTQLGTETRKLQDEMKEQQLELEVNRRCVAVMQMWKTSYGRQDFDQEKLMKQIDGLQYEMQVAEMSPPSSQPKLQECLNRVSSSYCSFEVTDTSHNETCWFDRLLTSDYNWRLMNGELIRNQRYSELTDHTCDSSNGRFLYLDLSLLHKDQEARLTSVPLVTDDTQCFSFWYNIKYKHNTAEFYAIVLMAKETGSWYAEILKVWEQNLGKQGQWQFAQFEIPAHVSRDGYKIQFVADSKGPGYIAMDDLTFTYGPCGTKNNFIAIN